MPLGAVAGSTADMASGQNVTERDVTVPTGTADGDILVAYAGLTQDNVTATAITGNGGFAAVATFPREATGDGDTGLSAVLMKKWQTGDPTVYTFQQNGGAAGSFQVNMIKVPGADIVPSVAPTRTNQATRDLTVECPDVTVPEADSLVVRFYHKYWYDAAKTGTPVWTPPAGHTEQCDSSGEWMSMGTATLAMGAGNSNGVAATSTAGNANGSPGRGVSLVLKSASTTEPVQQEQINITRVGAGATVSSGAGASVVPNMPTGWAADDMLYCIVANKSPSVATAGREDTGQVVIPDTPAGWERHFTFWNTAASESFAEGTGRTRLTVFKKLATAGMSAPTIASFASGTNSAQRVILATIVAYRAEAGRANVTWSADWWYRDNWATAVNNPSVTWTNPAFYTKDRLLLITSTRDNTAISAPVVSQPGSTFAALTASPASFISGNGYNISMACWDTALASGSPSPSSGNLTYSNTLGAVETGLQAMMDVYAFADIPPSPMEPGRYHHVLAA